MKGLSFFTFPKDPTLQQKWIAQMRRKNFIPKSHTVLCSEHFVEEDFEIHTRRSFWQNLAMPGVDLPKIRPRLLPGAVPSIFCFTKKPKASMKARIAAAKLEHQRVNKSICLIFKICS